MNYETSEPTVLSQVIPQNTTPPISFGVKYTQNEPNDKYDANRLIQLVPKPSRPKALNLIDIFEKQPNDITFDTKGTIFIDNEPLPNANMRLVFPALFKKRSKDVEGLNEVLSKLDQMELLHLVNRKRSPPPKVTTNLQALNWWYLK